MNAHKNKRLAVVEQQAADRTAECTSEFEKWSAATESPIASIEAFSPELECRLIRQISRGWTLYKRNRRLLGSLLTFAHRLLAKRGRGGKWQALLDKAGIPRASADRLRRYYAIYLSLPEALQSAAETADIDLVEPAVQGRIGQLRSELSNHPEPNPEMVSAWLRVLAGSDERRSIESDASNQVNNQSDLRQQSRCAISVRIVVANKEEKKRLAEAYDTLINTCGENEISDLLRQVLLTAFTELIERSETEAKADPRLKMSA